MEVRIQTQQKSPKLNITPILLVIALGITLFVWSNIRTADAVHESTPEVSLEDLQELAEEIYNSETISQAVQNLPIEAAALAKMIREIERIKNKTTDYPGCELYFLHVIRNGDYPVLGYGNAILGAVSLQSGDVWKVGQTCNGEKRRYNSDTYYKNTDFALTIDELEYKTVYNGTYKQVLILEKLMIYSYPFWSRHPELLKPPGCKIYR